MDVSINLLTDYENKTELLKAADCLKQFIQSRIDNNPKRASDLTILLF